MRSISVVIPTYNGRHLLEKNLPPLLAAVEGSNVPVEVLVVDDASSDGSVEFLRERFPGIRALSNDRNEGFAETTNRGIRAARNEIVFTLNNDIEVGPDVFTRGLARFDDPEVFSVTPIVIDVRSGKCQSITGLRPGICWYASFGLEPAALSDREGEIPVFYGLGGATFYDREKLLLLEGFDTIYHPFYMEDVDLSYRAWKAGWKCLLEPGTTVYHENSSTISSLHRRRKIKFLVERHRTLLLWLNVTDRALIVRYFLCLPFSMLYDIVAFRKYKFVGFFLALGYLPRIPAMRKRRMARFKVSDREVFRRVRQAGTVGMVLVFKPGPIGDFLHSFPAIAALRKRFPRARICVVTSQELSDLIEGNPLVDEKVYIPSNIFRGDLRGFLDFLRRVRSMRPDAFVDLRSNVKSYILGRMSGARTVLRYRKQRKPPEGVKRLHAIENLLATVFPLTGKVSPDYRIHLRAEDVRFAEAFIAQRLPDGLRSAPRVVLNPTVGAAIPSRLWPSEYFALLAERLRNELGAAVFITGGPTDKEYCERIAGAMPDQPVVTAGTLTLGQTAALIGMADLLVSGDTGPLHIAAGLGTKVIGLYGSVSTDRSRPFGEGHVVLKKDLWCLPCEAKVCPLGTMQCMKDITPDEVFGEAKKALGLPVPPMGRQPG